MNFKNFWRKEKYVALRAQTWRFRVVKYITIFALFGAVYYLSDLKTVAMLLFTMLVFALGLHFFFRYKTDAWAKSWGLYKKIPLENEL